MKNISIITIAFLFVSFSAFAQQDDDTTRIKIGKKKIIIIDENDEITDIDLDTTDFDFDFDDESSEDDGFNGHWFGVDIGLNNFVNSSQKMELPTGSEYLEINMGKSWGVGVNILEKSFNLYRDKIGVMTGLGLEFNNYRFDQNITLIGDQSELTYALDSIDFIKNKLTCSYLTVPLIFEAQIPAGKNDINIAIGAIGGLKLGSHSKQMYTENGTKIKDKVQDDFHLNTFRYGATVRLGFNGLNLFAIYNFSTLFEEDEGPELYPFTIGFSISF